jgi:hypothetical protein
MNIPYPSLYINILILPHSYSKTIFICINEITILITPFVSLKNPILEMEQENFSIAIKLFINLNRVIEISSNNKSSVVFYNHEVISYSLHLPEKSLITDSIIFK